MRPSTLHIGNVNIQNEMTELEIAQHDEIMDEIMDETIDETMDEAKEEQMALDYLARLTRTRKQIQFPGCG